MAHFDLENYETVASRITTYWKDHPQGRIATRLLSHETRQFVVMAEVYEHRDDTYPAATGLAEEHFADRGPNETSPLENCETSAIGRALVNWKYSSTAEKRPSREEMAKVNNGSSAPAPVERVTQIKEQAKSTSPKMEVESDSRWETILQGAQQDPSNTFLNDLREKGNKYGSLSDKQLAAGFNAATKILQTRPQPPKREDGPQKIVEQAFGTTEGWADDEEPF